MRGRDRVADDWSGHLAEAEQAAAQDQFLSLRLLRYLAAGCGLTAFVAAAAALVGRFTGNFMLASYHEGYKIIVPAAGLCLVLLAAAVTVLALLPCPPRALLRALGGTVMIIAGLRLAEYASGANWGTSELFLSPPLLPHAPEELPYALPTAVALFAGGLLLVLVARRMARALAFSLGGVVTTVGAAFVLGYVYVGPLLVGHRPMPIALPAAISMFLVGLGMAILMTAREVATQRLVGLRRREDQEELERLAAEAQQRAAELGTVIDSIADGVMIYDAEGCLLRLNAAARGLLQYTEAELKLPLADRVKLLNLHDAAGQPVAQERLPAIRALHGETIVGFATTMRPGTEREAVCLHSGAPLRGPQGDIIGAVITVTDVSNVKRAEAALRSSEHRLNRAQQIAHLGSWELDLVSGQLTWSDEVYRLFGLQPQEFGATYEAFLEHVYPDDRAAVDEAYTGSLRENRDAYELEHRLVRADTGEVRLVHERCEHVRDATGNLLRSEGMVHDITDRKRAEQALAQSAAETQRWAAELETTLRTIPNAVVILHLTGNPVRQNDAAVRLFGWSEEEQRLPWLERMAGRKPRTPAGEDIPIEHLPTARSLRGEVVSSMVFCIRCDAQEEIWLLVNSAPLRAEDGTLTGSVTTFVDITELQRAQRQAWQRADELDTVIEGITDGVVVYAADGTIVRTNQAAMMSQHLAAADHDTQLPERVRDMAILDQEGQPFPLDRLPTARALRGETVQREVTHVEQLDGSWRWFATSAAPLRDPTGAVTGAVTTFRDITSAREAEQELEAAYARLRTLFDRGIGGIGIFIANAQGGVMEANDYYLDRLGFSREELEQGEVRWAELTPSEWKPVDEKALAQLRERGICEPYEKEYQRRDGTRLPVLLVAATMPGDHDEILSFALDMTERKQAELERERLLAQVQAERERLFSVLSTFPAYVCLLTPDYECSFANKLFTDLFGEGQPGQKCYNLLWGRDEPCEDCQSYDCLTDDKPKVWEWLGPNGAYFEVYDHPFVDTDGTRLVLEVGFDISERKRTEGERERLLAQVEEERQRMYSVLDMMPGYVALIGQDYEFRYVSQKYVGLFGQPAPGQKCYDLTLGYDAPCENCRAFEPLADGRPVEYDWYKDDGKILRLANYRFVDTDGTVLSLETGLDVTAARQAEAERQRLVAELAASEERYRMVGELLPHGVWTSDADGQVTYVSQSLLEFLGVSFEEYAGSGWSRLCHPDDPQPTLDAWLAVARGEKDLWSYECRLLGRDGEYHWVLSRGVPLRDASGAITSWVGTNTDTDVIKAAEIEREHLAERLTVLIETMPAGVLMCDAEGQSTLVNEHMREMMGLRVTGDASGPTAGHTLHHLDGSPYEPEELPLLQALRQDRTIGDVEMVFHTTTGAQVFTLASACPLHDREGKVFGAVTVLRDITALHLAQEELRAQRAFLQQALDQMPSGVLVIEAGTTRVMLANQSIAGIWGQDMAGVVMSEFLAARRGSGPDSEFSGARDWPCLRALHGEEIHNETVRVTRSDGTLMHVSASAAPVRDERGQIIAAIVAATDVTAAAEAQEELARYRDHLEDLITQRTAELVDSERKYRELVQDANSVVLRLDADGIIEFANEYAEQLFGYDPGELIGKSAMAIMPERDEAGHSREDFVEAVRANPEAFSSSENENVTTDGRRLWMTWSTRVIRDVQGALAGMTAIGTDHTAQHEAEKELQRLNRVYTVLSRANEAIVRARSSEELFADISRVIVEQGQFRMAWVGLLDTATGRIVPHTHWGHEDGYLNAVTVSTRQTPDGSGPTGTAVREGVYQVSNDIANDPRMARWAEEAARRGYRSSGAFPFQAGAVTGTLNIYSDETNFFDEQKIQLLEALAANVSIAVEREKVERDLRAHQVQLRELASALSLAEEKERRRIAASIHDDLIQNLAFAKMKLALTRTANPSAEVIEGLDAIGALLDEAIRYTRGLTFEISLPILYQLGFEPALEWLAEHMQERHGYATRVVSNPQTKRLSQDLQVALFQAVRELLTNAAKHAEATEVVLSVTWRPDEVEIAVADNGVGLDPETVESSVNSGFGLFHIRERARHLGGRLEIAGAPGAGATFTIIMPLPDE